MTGTSNTRSLLGAAAAFAAVALITVCGAPAEAQPASAEVDQAPAQADAASGEANLLANPSFEELDEDGWPNGWHPMWASSVDGFWSDSDHASDGDRSVRVLDESDARGYALRSDAVPVSAGDSYRLALDARVDSGDLRASILYLDDAGERVSIEHEPLSDTGGVWYRQSLVSTVPEGATQVQVLIDTVIAWVCDAWVDHVTLTPAVPDEAAGTEENLGQPITGLTNAGAGYTEDAQGRDIGLVVAGGSPSMFSAVDLITGERLASEPVEGSVTWAYATAPDRMAYLATSHGQVYRFDPDALTLTQIAYRPFGERYFWEGGASADGEIFWATYPGGKLLGYQPGTDTWQDYGTLVEGNIYARSLALAGDHVYVGGGTGTPSLVQVDTTSGDIEPIPLPAQYADQEFVYDVSVAEQTLFARVKPDNTILVYSLTERAWVDTIENAVGLDVSPAVHTSDSGTDRNEVLIPQIGGGTIAYDLDTRERRTVSIDLGGASARGWALLEVGLDGFPGQSLVTATSKAVFHVWNPETGQTRSMRTDAAGTPFVIRSLATGPQGNTWVGGYLSPPGVARVDAVTGQSEQLPGPSQAEGMLAHGDDMLIGTYPGALVYTYDSTEDWDNGTNPPERISIGHGQDRPVAWASAGDVVAIGTVPDYGHLGGALTLLDPDTQQMTVYEDLIEDQTVVTLAYADGLIYGGTGIWGGLGTDPATSEGQLFVFDPSTGEVVFQTVPVPGEENVSGLTFGPDGDLWGITANTLFRFDPDTREVVQRQRYFDVDDSGAYVTGRDLFWHGDRLVGQTAGRVFEIDPETLRMTVLATGTQNLAIDRLGHYYYSRGGTLYRWVPQVPVPTCDQRIDGRHTGGLRVTDVLCVTGAELAGPVQVTSGGSLVLTDSTVVGPVTTEGAGTVQLRSSHITGPVSITGTSGAVLVAGNEIVGPLRCTDNAAQPSNGGEPNSVSGPATGQCTGL